MTSIVGYTDLLRLKKCDEKTTKKALDYIYSESKRLEKLSFKLMELMSISENEIKLEIFEITDFIKKIVTDEENIIKTNKIIIQADKSNVKGDKDLLQVVIKNLLENSNKAEPKDNKIIIKGEKLKNKKYRISIIDKGIGIPKQDINRVTEDFYMVDKSRSRKNGGSGIGLSLVKKILKYLGTDIFIESKENVGTTVYFELKEE